MTTNRTPATAESTAITDWESGYEAAMLDLMDAEETSHEQGDLFGPDTPIAEASRYLRHAHTLAVVQRLLSMKQRRYDRHGKRITN